MFLSKSSRQAGFQQAESAVLPKTQTVLIILDHSQHQFLETGLSSGPRKCFQNGATQAPAAFLWDQQEQSEEAYRLARIAADTI